MQNQAYGGLGRGGVKGGEIAGERQKEEMGNSQTILL